jgi:hypothetical protein
MNARRHEASQPREIGGAKNATAAQDAGSLLGAVAASALQAYKANNPWSEAVRSLDAI